VGIDSISLQAFTGMLFDYLLFDYLTIYYLLFDDGNCPIVKLSNCLMNEFSL